MKKIITFTFILSFLLLNTMAQDDNDFPLNNAEWITVLQHEAEHPEYLEYVYHFYYDGEALIDGINRSKLSCSSFSYRVNPTNNQRTLTDQSNGLLGYIHTVGLKVYFRLDDGDWLPGGEFALCVYDSNPDQLLYDFELIEGSEIYNDCSGDYIVETVDIININGSERQRFGLKSLPYGKEIVNYWIKGIGDTQGLFEPIRAIPTGGGNKGLVAFVQNGEVAIFEDDYEDLVNEIISSINTPLKNLNIQIFQNPLDRTISVLSSSNKLTSVRLYSLTGGLLFDETGNGRSSTTISTDKISTGVYLVKLSLDNGQSFVKKVIVK